MTDQPPDMSVRDRFAAYALQAIIARLPSPSVYDQVADQSREDNAQRNRERVARAAYRYADAMLKAREG